MKYFCSILRKFAGLSQDSKGSIDSILLSCAGIAADGIAVYWGNGASGTTLGSLIGGAPRAQPGNDPQTSISAIRILASFLNLSAELR